MTMTMARTLPHWDMTPFFPSLESAEFEAAFQSLIRDIGKQVKLFEEYRIDKSEATTVDADTIQRFETLVDRINLISDDARLVITYIQSFIATNSRNNLAQAKMSELQQHLVRLSQLGTRFTAWIGSLDVEALIEASDIAQAHAFMLRKAKLEALHLMSPVEEALAAELNVSAGSAWARLHGNVTSQLTVTMELNGEPKTLPMSMIRALATDPDRETRRRAYQAELDAWPKVAVPLAAALNSIKAEVNTLGRKRNWGSALDESVSDNNMDRASLDAMLDAARDAFPDFRRYLRAKAKTLGSEQLPWYDLFAPLGTSHQVWEYEDATAFILKHFADYSHPLRDFAGRAFRENWVDAEPREGKRDGGFCMGIRQDVSRIFMNYKPAFNSVATLAHELGHAYHNLALAKRTPMQRGTPMTLAETASTFCETLIFQAALQQASPQERLALLDRSLQDATQIVVDISSRFLFEKTLLEKRQTRELSIDELNEAMLDAQRATYGDGLDPTLLHPYMWAVKPHYYSTGRSFYNYPYMFGLLFGLGLYALYQQDPAGFKASYDDLLSSTGLADAATLAGQFGIDIRAKNFWQGSLDTIRQDIDSFVSLVNKGGQ